MTLLETAPVEGRPLPLRRRGPAKVVVAVLATLVVAGLAGGYVSWRLRGGHPELSRGSVTMTPAAPVRVANDGIEDTKYVLDSDGAEGELRFSLRNDGSDPVTVLGLAAPEAGPAYGPWSYLGLKPFGPLDGPSWDGTGPGPLTLEPGAEALVVLRARLSPCVPWSAGAGTITDTVPLRVRQLGITTTQELPLPLPLYARAVHDLPAHGTAAQGCHAG